MKSITEKEFNPLISIIIPTYNHGELLNKALRSVLNQSFKNFEIVVIDNFSDDDTQKIVENFGSGKIVYEKIKRG